MKIRPKTYHARIESTWQLKQGEINEKRKLLIGFWRRHGVNFVRDFAFVSLEKEKKNPLTPPHDFFPSPARLIINWFYASAM